MNANQGLILALYAGFAGLILLTGFIYKEIREFRKRRKSPKFNFTAQKPDIKNDAHEDHPLALTR